MLRTAPAGRIERDCAVDEIGIVCIRGPNMFPGYLRDEDNRNVWAEDGEGRWLNTGDLGRMDAEGYCWLTGRAKDLIIRGGHNIDPQMIEEALCHHPAVAIAAAIGQPDSYAGEIPVAYVALRAGMAATAEELHAFARQKISERAAVPTRIEVLPQLPVTAVGKIFIKHGALRYREYQASDLKVEEVVPFDKTVKLKRGETLIYAAVEFKSEAHRNKVMKAVMADPKLMAMCSPDDKQLFDYTRMVYGGFRILVDL